jgi:hypothetical protein
MSWTSRLSFRYLLLLVLLFRPPTIMLIDLGVLEWTVGVAYLWRGRQVALLSAILRRVVVTSPVVAALVVLAATSVIAMVVAVAM